MLFVVSSTVHDNESCSFLLSLLFCCDDDVITTDLWLGTTTILWWRLSAAGSERLTRSVHGTVYCDEKRSDGDQKRDIAAAGAQETGWQPSSGIQWRRQNYGQWNNAPEQYSQLTMWVLYIIITRRICIYPVEIVVIYYSNDSIYVYTVAHVSERKSVINKFNMRGSGYVLERRWS